MSWCLQEIIFHLIEGSSVKQLSSNRGIFIWLIAIHQKKETFWIGYSFARLIGPLPSSTDDMATTVFHWKIVQMFQLPTDKSHFPTICLCMLPTVKFQPLDTLKIWLYKFLVTTQLRLDPYRHWHQTNVFLLSAKRIPWCLGYRDNTQE